MNEPARDTKKRLTKLRQLVAYHRDKYHQDDTPEITDAAYDTLVAELRELELLVEGKASVSDQVGGSVNTAFAKVRHTVPQWSFDNVFDQAELQSWDERAQRLLREADVDTPYSYVAEHKIDGLKLVLTYKQGRLVQAATRGDGVVGEDVTHTAKTIASLPWRLTEPVDLICVGEVWLSATAFQSLNAEQAAKGLPLFANPRNAAAGTLRQLDPQVAKDRGLSLFCYDIDQFSPASTPVPSPLTQMAEHELLAALGLPTNPAVKWCANLAAVEKYYQTWLPKRDSLAYGIDGVVVKINEINVQNILGYTAKAPRFGIAYKFPAEQATTIVEAIDLQVGRTGVITPVAHLRPVRIAGSTVARATLHNEDQIKRLDIRVGDTVVLQKAGDVIPEVVAVLKELRPPKTVAYKFPTVVAGCGGDGRIERVTGEAAYRCVTLDSPVIHRQKLYYFVSKPALNIDGVGPKLIDQLLAKELVSTPVDLFRLRLADVRALEGFKDKSAANVIKAIAEARHQPLYRVLVALGIPEVGEETAHLLADNFSTLDQLLAASVTDLEAIHGIGTVVATNLVEWFANPAHRSLLDELKQELTIEAPVTAASQSLRGLSIVVTGTLKQFSRDEVKEVIRQHGGTVSSSVSAKTAAVVVGAEAGSKVKEATRLGVPQWTETEFVKRIASKPVK